MPSALCSSESAPCRNCGAELPPEGGACIDGEDAVDTSIVCVGSRWTTRGSCARKVVVLAVRGGYATVADEDRGARGVVWTEKVERIEREWTRRASDTRMRAVTVGPVLP